jgi:hypothetical protein
MMVEKFPDVRECCASLWMWMWMWMWSVDVALLAAAVGAAHNFKRLEPSGKATCCRSEASGGEVMLHDTNYVLGVCVCVCVL